MHYGTEMANRPMLISVMVLSISHSLSISILLFLSHRLCRKRKRKQICARTRVYTKCVVQRLVIFTHFKPHTTLITSQRKDRRTDTSSYRVVSYFIDKTTLYFSPYMFRRSITHFCFISTQFISTLML